MDYQKVIFAGRLGRDPETRYFNDSSAVCTLNIASGERWRDRASGENRERTTWLRCACFGRTAELAAEYLRKGSRVMVEGKLQNEEWEKDGQKHSTLSLRVDRLVFVDTKRDAEQGQGRTTTAPAASGDPVFDDDIPF
jgi:single-strand DNA-binding protein